MSRVVLVCGMPQEGKTTLALAEVTRRSPRVLVLDPARSKPFNALHDEQFFQTWDELAKWLLQNPGARGRWLVALRSQEESHYVEALRAARWYRYTTILVDEALVFTTHPDALPPLIKVARTGAHFGNGTGVQLWLTAQRPMDIPTDVRATITQLYSFRMREPRDLQWISGFASPEFADEVAALGPHCHAVFPPPEQKAIKERTVSERESDLRDRPHRAGSDVGGQQEPGVRVPEADRRLTGDGE